uniref:ABC transporter domain-containing protein n=1 Tax=Oxyrrhis marina TaxID=2969 RepID=A0A7S4LQW6_OXYMA|mmetsp:Transcript_27190/g.65448  ORF Transcript_27190/g.65448 Transcript_27190/m.65448 type:complete len:617 (-) Transcript_27190:245-2095(-)
MADLENDNKPMGPFSEVEKAQVKVFQNITKEAPHLTWDNLGFSVTVKGQPKQILKGVSGEVKPGQCTAILGPSGSGKTSLLNILAGRVKPKRGFSITGDVCLAGTPVDPVEHQRIFGYVMQEDSLYATSTPREIMSFSAKMRLPVSQAADAPKLTEDLLESLGLSNCANSMVGSELIKGISGGEKKRTAIGAELITNPEILFLDEPTSGLDSYAAFNVISILRQLAHQKQVVLCTIHQPSSEILHLFDSVVFLAQGNIIYQGPPTEIRSYFEARGHPCHTDFNPADFVMFLIQTAKQEEIDALVKAWQERVEDIKRERSAEVHRGITKEELAKLGTQSHGFFAELAALFPREVRNTFRDKATLGARFGVSTLLNIIYSSIFWGVGDTDSLEYDLQSHSGAITFFCIGGMFSAAQPLLLTFPFERPVFLREHSSGMYGVAPYFVSKMLAELPLHLLVSILTYLIGYWSCGFNGSFIGLVLGTWAISSVAASTALLVGSSVADIKKGLELVPAIFVPQILFAGFFIKIELIPEFLRWLQYACFLKWGVNIVLTEEFKDIDKCLPTMGACQDGPTFLESSLDTSEDTYWLNWGILIGLFVVFRITAAAGLKGKAKALYN